MILWKGSEAHLHVVKYWHFIGWSGGHLKYCHFKLYGYLLICDLPLLLRRFWKYLTEYRNTINFRCNLTGLVLELPDDIWIEMNHLNDAIFVMVVKCDEETDQWGALLHGVTCPFIIMNTHTLLWLSPLHTVPHLKDENVWKMHGNAIKVHMCPATSLWQLLSEAEVWCCSEHYLWLWMAFPWRFLGCWHRLQGIVLVRSFLRLLNLQLAVGKNALSRRGLTRCHSVLDHG